ncbi:MAG TPA: ATP-binding protein, partial [Sediminibacterium sp.]|nr:ATP-binding protein [Sediminibacterium sp.]
DKENLEANASLKLEINKRDESINSLKEAVKILKDKTHSFEEEDVLVLSNFVKDELAKRRNAESVFSSIINNLKSGILLENEKQKILYCNNHFSCLFHFNESKEKLQGNNFIPRLIEMSRLFVHPEIFRKRVEQIMINKQDIASEILEMKDGRILDRSYATIYTNGEFKGHFWNYTDITEKKKAEQEIIQQRQFYNEILDNIPADIAVLDSSQKYIYLNPYAVKDEETRKWIIGKNDFDYFESKGKGQEIAIKRRELFEKAISTSKGLEFIDEHRRGKSNTFILRKFYPHFENAQLKFVIGYGIDITAIKVAEIKLANAMNKLKKTNEELEQFAYVASHDLQEPLRMVSSFLGLLEKKYSSELDEKAKSYINFAVDGAQRMRQIILDLLEFSRVGRTGDHQLEVMDLNKIMHDVIQMHMQQVQDNGAKIKFNNLPVIKNYRIPLTQVIQNLLSNGLKYRKEDVQPELEISVSDRGNEWEFSFKDNGIGINSKYYDKIFEIFQRLHNKNTYSGTGIGLSVVKKTIESLGGKIWVESEEGLGSTFYFTVPKDYAEHQDSNMMLEQINSIKN